MISLNGALLSLCRMHWSSLRSLASLWPPCWFHSVSSFLARSGKRTILRAPSSTSIGDLGTFSSLTTVEPCFQTRPNSVSLMCRLSTFSGVVGVSSLFGSGGPGTCASALMREFVTHTAVMRRNAMVTMSRSMNGIMLISLFVARFFPPPSPTSTPPMASPSSSLEARLDGSLPGGAPLGGRICRVLETTVIRPMGRAADRHAHRLAE
jgi:hypothetical protein